MVIAVIKMAIGSVDVALGVHRKSSWCISDASVVCALLQVKWQLVLMSSLWIGVLL